MSINSTHLNSLNDRDSKTAKIFLKMMNLFSGKPDIIQIGIGGYSSSGKTVLIDALFSFFDSTAIPGFMPKNDAGIFLDASEHLPAYSNHYDLRKKVSNYFHQDHATRDEGVCFENTHCAKLQFSRKTKILLIRNIPGEMFSVYCQQMGNEDSSLKTRFKLFLAENSKYKSILPKLFKFQAEKKGEEQKKFIETTLTEIKDAFFKAIKLTDYPIADAIPKIERNFFAFLFYYTSDFNIYCIKSTGLDDEERAVANDNIFREHSSKSDRKRFIICFTQFDRILNNGLPQLNSLPENAKVSAKRTFKEAFLETIGIKNENGLSAKINSELLNYWKTMNDLYHEIESGNYTLVNAAGWQNIRELTGSHRHSWFCTSVAYNFNRRSFLAFQNQVAGNNDVWQLANNNQRTPIGVLEILLYILKQNGITENSWKLPLPSVIEFKTIRNKIGIN